MLEGSPSYPFLRPALAGVHTSQCEPHFVCKKTKARRANKVDRSPLCRASQIGIPREFPKISASYKGLTPKERRGSEHWPIVFHQEQWLCRQGHFGTKGVADVRTL